MNTIVITARTDMSLTQAQSVLSEPRTRQDAEVLGLMEPTVTHWRSEDGVIEPAGMGDQSVSEITAPPAPPVVAGQGDTVTLSTDVLVELLANVKQVQADQERVMRALSLRGGQ